MATIKNIILAGLSWLLFLFVLGCSSSPKAEEETIEVLNSKGNLKLSTILEHPQLYVDKEVMFEGVIESVDIRKVNKDITLLTLMLTPVENGELLKSTKTLSDKFLFIEKLRQFEDLFTSVRYKNIRIQRYQSEYMKKLAIDLKIAANNIEALAYYFEGVDRKGVAVCVHKVADGYLKLGDAFFKFQKAALQSSPGTEARFSPENKEQVEKFETSLRKGGQLLLDFSNSLVDSKKVILDGHYSYDSTTALNKQRPSEILTYSSLLNAEAWEKEKAVEVEEQGISSALSVAVKDLGEGDKLVNEGMIQLGELLNKTAVQLKKDSVPTLKCAYFGYNGSNLKRAVNALKAMKHYPIGLHGTLLQSDLREEVNVMWVKAKLLNIDGLVYSLDYGDESGTLRNAVNFYEWAESVEKGGK